MMKKFILLCMVGMVTASIVSMVNYKQLDAINYMLLAILIRSLEPLVES